MDDWLFKPIFTTSLEVVKPFTVNVSTAQPDISKRINYFKVCVNAGSSDIIKAKHKPIAPLIPPHVRTYTF